MTEKQCEFLLKSVNENFRERRKQRDGTAKVDAAIKAALKEFAGRPERRTAFEKLLACVRSHSDLLKPTTGKGWVGPVFLINRLRNLAARQAHWIRPCEEWRPTSANLRPAFHSLAMHLLAFYPTPGFLDAVWDLPFGAEGFRQQSWHIKLARGASLRQLTLPLVLTRRMEHFVRHAPDHFGVSQAFRYGETRGLGGSEQLAREIATGPLGREIRHPGFWRPVLHFFAQHPELDLRHINPIIDFIQYHKFPSHEVLTEQPPVSCPALWPSFSINGRTPKSMLRLTWAWHSDLAKNKQSHNFTWPKSGIEGYRFEDTRDGDEHPRVWSIEELLQSQELYAEGRALHHCVYTYAAKCRNRQTTIWSLKLKMKEGEKNMATIEIDAKRRRITQVRAKRNLPAGGRSLEIIQQWAAWAGLDFETNPRTC